MLTHVGINQEQCQQWRETDRALGRRLKSPAASSIGSMSKLTERTLSAHDLKSGSQPSPSRSKALSIASSSLSGPVRQVPMDPVLKSMMYGPPVVTSNFAASAAAALARR
eukprot:TRINITY_DN86133_c0_g1_i1.p2 TRINITY_DN86133_c0_g1~~TRINITY_DN86133_c0_g1_i1.p2  ORF type:complete len:110 (-),score=25.66 TRINITY_DN86133_c0_g1_i1:67-396(-)